MMQDLLELWHKTWRLATFTLFARRSTAVGITAWAVLWPLVLTGGLIVAFDDSRSWLGATPSDRLWAVYLGVLTWTTVSTVLIRNVRILPVNRELIRGLRFRFSILPVAETMAGFLLFLAQLLVALAVWLATAAHAQWLPLLTSLAIFLVGFVFTLLALAWTASLLGAVAPGLASVLPPLLVLLLVVSPVVYPGGSPWHWSLAVLTHFNPLSLCVASLYETLGLMGPAPIPPLGFLAGAIAATAGARLLVLSCLGNVAKVV